MCFPVEWMSEELPERLAPRLRPGQHSADIAAALYTGQGRRSTRPSTTEVLHFVQDDRVYFGLQSRISDYES